MRSALLVLAAVAAGGALGGGLVTILVADAPQPSVIVERVSVDGVEAEVRLENRSRDERHYTVTVFGDQGAILRSSQARWTVAADTERMVPVAIGWSGPRPPALYLRIDDDRGTQRVVEIRL